MVQVIYPGKDKVVGACLSFDHCSALGGMVIKEKTLCALSVSACPVKYVVHITGVVKKIRSCLKNEQKKER
jgi:hypothetical protein